MKKIISILIIIFSICIISKINAYTEYKVGDEVKYNNVDYYVIKDSSSKDDSVTMLKAEPFTVEEVNLYGGVGTANNHVNMYVTIYTDAPWYQTAYIYDESGYGGMAYYSSPTCGYLNRKYFFTGCTISYEDSEVKYVVDAWKKAEAPLATEVRLITLNDMKDNLGYVPDERAPEYYMPSSLTPTWIFNGSNDHWTSSPYYYDYNLVSDNCVRTVTYHGELGYRSVIDPYGVVQPVIVLSKTELGDEDESVIEDKEEIDDKENKIDKEDDKNDNTSKELKVEKSDNKVSSEVKVANTYMSKSITIIVVGFIVSVLSILIFYKYINKKV